PARTAANRANVVLYWLQDSYFTPQFWHQNNEFWPLGHSKSKLLTFDLYLCSALKNNFLNQQELFKPFGINMLVPESQNAQIGHWLADHA
ncbi:MAG: hypothetical protein ABL936_27355, partial [Aestuariivirga sp.]